MACKIKEICCYSYNCRGIGSNKIQFINDLLDISSNNMPVLCLQEHFLLRNNVYKLCKGLKNYTVLPKPAHKDFQSLDYGRPKGGLATVIPTSLRKYVTVLNCQSWRLQPLKFCIGGESILLINSYFPTDERNDEVNEELINILAEIRVLVSSQYFSSLVILGDLNCDFSRASGHVSSVRNFAFELNLYASLWSDFEFDFTYMCENQNGELRTSTIDHFLLLNRDRNKVIDAGVVHNIDNLSDHEPIYLKLSINADIERETSSDPILKSRPKWKLATTD